MLRATPCMAEKFNMGVFCIVIKITVGQNGNLVEGFSDIGQPALEKMSSSSVEGRDRYEVCRGHKSRDCSGFNAVVVMQNRLDGDLCSEF